MYDIFRNSQTDYVFETDPPMDMDPCRLIWQIFQELFLSRSVSDGLIDPENLSLAGDGTPIRTAARERKRRNYR